VRLQNGDDITEVDPETPDPGGQLVLMLMPSEQGSTLAQIGELTTI
jgi:hypothetical protein